MSDEGRSIEEIAADLQDTRGKLRESEKNLQQVPALKREKQRLSDVAEKKEAQRQEAVERVNELEAQVRELEQQLRSQESLEEEIQQAQADRADALAEQEASEDALSSANSLVNDLRVKLADAYEQIGYLKKHEKQTQLLNKALAAAKELD